ncbi:MAG: hypothetical protein NZP74_13770 [Anaerolineales bacterium]|nr:hypothetical protein [Anaerolineales bacterium]
MPPLHLSPETAHQTAALLQRQAGMLFEAAHALRRDLARLQIAWQGNGELCTSPATVDC